MGQDNKHQKIKVRKQVYAEQLKRLVVKFGFTYSLKLFTFSIGEVCIIFVILKTLVN